MTSVEQTLVLGALHTLITEGIKSSYIDNGVFFLPSVFRDLSLVSQSSFIVMLHTHYTHKGGTYDKRSKWKRALWV